MTSWTYLTRFSAEDGAVYYTTTSSTLPQVGEKVVSFSKLSDIDKKPEDIDLSSQTIKEVRF
jgi:hypothetical protein